MFGGGKVTRDGMGQNGQRTRAADIPDTAITNVIVLEYSGIYKADVALRDGHIFQIGKAGNPDISDGVDITIGGGNGPSDARKASTVTPGGWHISMMLQAVDNFPINIGQLGKGHASARARSTRPTPSSFPPG